MNWGKLLTGISIAAAPFTGGASLYANLAKAGIAGAGAIGGALSNTKAARTSTTNPIEDPAYSPLKQKLIEMSLAKLNNPTALPPGFVSGGIQRINANSDLQRQAIENALSARGLSGSPVAGTAAANAETGRIGQINQLENVIAPQYEQQLHQQDLENATGVFNNRRTGTEQVGAGSVAGGGFTSAAELLALMYGSGAFGEGMSKRGPAMHTGGIFG